MAFRMIGPLFPSLFATWGIRLWATTRRLPWRDWENEILDLSSMSQLHIGGEAIRVYQWGNGNEKILLAHGWNSRASHFRKYIELLVTAGFQVIGFDAAGHGNSSGHRTNIVDYVAILSALDGRTGPFKAIIGHSFGGFSIPYALNHGLRCSKAVILAAPDSMEWLFDRFAGMIKAPDVVLQHMRLQLVERYGDDFWNTYNIGQNAPSLGHIPALIIHDEEDPAVPSAIAGNIHRLWPGSSLLLTTGLGHDRILRHGMAVEPVIRFIVNHKHGVST